MKKDPGKLFVAHYEPLSDGRYVLCVEPNIFDTFEDCSLHMSCLSYLSGMEYFVIPEIQLVKNGVVVPSSKAFVYET